MATNNQVKISNAAIWVNGVAVFGGPNEVTIEAVKAKTAERMSLGMQGTVEYPVGIEKMSMTIKLNHVDANTTAQFSDVYNTKQFQLRTTAEVFTPSGRTAVKALVYKVNAMSKTAMPSIGLKAQEPAEFEAEFSIFAITVELDSVEMFHFDALGNTHRVNGQNQLAAVNAILGI
jgi:uncharacterized protein